MTAKPVPHVPVVLPPLVQRPTVNVSSRRGARVHLVVVHRPVGSYAGSIAALCDPHHEASAHIIMKPGGLEATQLVRWDMKAWACVAFNAFSDNLEIADEVWVGKDPHGWQVAARIVAFRCHQRKIPPVWTPDPLNVPGVARHYDLGVAGGGHTDPTLDKRVWQRFMTEVRAQYDRGGFRRVWGVGDPAGV
jgi:hypothetical protein